MSILDTDKIITSDWLRSESWIKTPSFTKSRNPWWSKNIFSMNSNGYLQTMMFAYNDETRELLHMIGFPYPKIIAQDVNDIELFIKDRLKYEHI